MEGLMELDRLTVWDVVDNETDGLSTACKSCMPGSGTGVGYQSELPGLIAREGAMDFREMCSAAHGLSLLCVAEKDGGKHTCLFDSGPTPQVWEENSAKLHLDLGEIEVAVLSHYHIDHFGGLRSAVPAISKARASLRLPPPIVDLASPAITSRSIKLPSGKNAALAPDCPSPKELEELGASVELRDNEPHLVCGGSFYVSGHIPRNYSNYEQGLPGHMSMHGDGWEEDPEVMDERYLACKVKGKGLVVFSACSHAGIINVCTDAVSKGGGSPLLGVMGGFHLAGNAELEGRVAATVKDLHALKPAAVFAGHCSGWRAKAALAEAFQDRFQPSVVGGCYTFSATA